MAGLQVGHVDVLERQRALVHVTPSGADAHVDLSPLRDHVVVGVREGREVGEAVVRAAAEGLRRHGPGVRKVDRVVQGGVVVRIAVADVEEAEADLARRVDLSALRVVPERVASRPLEVPVVVEVRGLVLELGARQRDRGLVEGSVGVRVVVVGQHLVEAGPHDLSFHGVYAGDLERSGSDVADVAREAQQKARLAIDRVGGGRGIGLTDGLCNEVGEELVTLGTGSRHHSGGEQSCENEQ